MDDGHAIRIEAGVSFAWPALPPLRDRLDGIEPGAERLQLRRVGRNMRGLAGLSSLAELWLHNCDQATLEAAAALPRLRLLFVRGFTATSLAPLGGHPALERLILVGGSKVPDLAPLAGLSRSLDVLFLEGFRRVGTLEPVSALGRLTAFGFEGGMDSHVAVPTLRPLAALAGLRSLFLASTKVADRSLAPLGELAGLRRLECMAGFPDEEFVALKRRLPNLSCDWIDMIEDHGSIRAGLATMRRRWRGGA